MSDFFFPNCFWAFSVFVDLFFHSGRYIVVLKSADYIAHLCQYETTMLPRTARLWSRHASRIMLLQEAASKFCFPSATHAVREIKKPSTEIVTLHGHLHRKPRIHAKRLFAELRDDEGDVIQIHLAPEFTEQSLIELLASSGVEDAIVVSGLIQEKPPKKGSTEKEYELAVSHFQNLNSGGIDAAQLDKLKHNQPSQIPPHFRYLQLRTPFYQHALRTRSKAVNYIRKILVDGFGFTEIDTPLLFKSTPEGAREFLVPTRSPDRFYALPQSPQQYKQILMSSGFSKYFQIARCFRDEDLRADRQPEFTQVDLEMSFVNDKTQVMNVINSVISKLWANVGKQSMYTLDENLNLKVVKQGTQAPETFSPITYKHCLSKYGIDKPDLRSSLSFIDISKFFTPMKETTNFPVVEVCVLKSAFDPAIKGKISHRLSDTANYKSRKPIAIAIQNEDDVRNWFTKFVERGVLAKTRDFDSNVLAEMLDLAPGDVLAFSTRAHLSFENPTPLGRFRQLAIEEYPNKWNRPIVNEDGSLTTDYSKNDIFVGSWVIDFPLFSPVELEGNNEFPQYSESQIESTHHPFTMANLEDFHLLETDPLSVRGEHYDFVLNGVEVGGGSRRIHDPKLQEYIFKHILKISNYEQLFGHLLKALGMGCPPHAGIALGLDRVCAMLIGSQSIRDVIAFPKNQSGTDPVVESPTDVPSKILEEYYIKKLESH